MKKLIGLLLVLLAMIFVVTACVSDDENNQNQDQTGGVELEIPAKATVWYYGTDVHIIPAMNVDRESLSVLRDELDVIAKNAYVSSAYAENQKCELVVGYVEDRDVSVKAYRLLERMDKDHYFDGRFVIYAEAGSVAIAYDENEYSTIQTRDFAIEYFIENYVSGKEYVAFGAFNRVEEHVDLIYEQELIDGEKRAAAWDKIYLEAGGDSNPNAASVLDAFKSMHGMYDDNVVLWFANLYDPSVGGFYANSSGRNNEGFLPDIQSTVQALSWISGSGMIDFVDGDYGAAIPEWMRNQIIAFAKGLQSSKNGYFYHPQWTQEMVDNKISRRGRDLGWATSVLKALGSAPTYNAPDGTRGDGVDVYEFWESVDWYGYIGDKSEFETTALTSSLGISAAEAVAKLELTSDVVLTANDNTDYFATHENFYNYLQSLELEGHSYTIGNDFDATKAQILTKSRELGQYTLDESKPYYGMTLVEMWLDYYNKKAIPESGIWETDTDFDGTNGFMKTHTSYNYYGAALPYPLASAKTIIEGLTSDQRPRHVCDNYNLWVSLSGIKENVTKYADDQTREEVLAYIDNALMSNATEIINKTAERVSMFKKSDGSFSYREFSDSATAQEMPVGLGVNEGGIDATGICTRGNFNYMFRAFGFTEVAIFGEADWMRFCLEIEKLGPVMKFEADSTSAVIDFEDGSLRGAFQAMRGATADIVEYGDSHQLCVGIGTSTAAPGVDINKTLSTSNGDYVRVEMDVTFMYENDGYYQFIFNATHKTSKKPMYFQFITKGDSVSIKDMRFGSAQVFEIGKRGQQIHLCLEYFLNSVGQSALRINSNGNYLGTLTNTGKNSEFVTGALPKDLSRIEFAGNVKNGGVFYIDNFFYGLDYYKDLDGDDLPDVFPDVEGEEVFEESGTKPMTPNDCGVIDFEDMKARDNDYVIQKVANTLRVTEKGGSDRLEFIYRETDISQFDLSPTLSEDGATQMILEADVTDCLGNPRTVKIYAGTKLIYDFRFNGIGGITSENNQLGWGKGYYEKDVTYRLKITVEVADGKLDVHVYVNGTEVKRPSGYGTKMDITQSSDVIGKISRISVAYGSSTRAEGSVFIDNYRFVKLATPEVHVPTEPPHEHKFVNGKCECGEVDPNYKPENPDVPSDHEHKYVDGSCECGAPDPNYKPGTDDPITPPTGGKTMKVLMFGNSYSVDAAKWMSKIFLEAGYDTFILGNVASSGCCINEHWAFLDGIDGNEPNGGSFFYRKYVNGKEVEVEDDYAFAIADENWDIITIQHAPDELKQVNTYSHLQDFIDYILERTTNPDVKLVYQMIWAHNNVADIKGLYNTVLQITDAYVTVSTDIDGLIPTATMIEYLRDNGLTNAYKNDEGKWVAGDITRDWGHLNYGLGRYALGLIYYAYLTGESIDDFTWVPTVDMVTSEADGFAEITPEKLAIIKAAIKYALANPYGEDYEPKNGDGVGFPNCEMGGNDFAEKPLTPDKNGYIDFENMTAVGNSFAVARTEGMLKVTEKNGSNVLEFIYTEDKTQEFDLYPTKSESGATIMIFEADVTDSLGQPRTLTFYAGTKKVYDFRFNGIGGITSENNQLSWGKGYYEKDVTYRLKITIQVTDGKIDTRVYINGTEITKPSKYGTGYDLTADADTVSKISRVYVAYGYSTKYAGSVYIDNYRFVKLAGDDTPAEPPHEHSFVEGKCECGETDPNYKPENPDTPVEPDAPLIDKDGFVSFEGIDAIPAEIATAQTGTINVKENGGSNALEFVYEKGKTEAFTLYPTKSDDGATKLIIEADVTDSYGSPRFLKIYAGSTVVYDFRINGAGGFASESNSVWWGGGHYTVGETYNLKIEATVTDGKLDLNLYINGNLVTRPSAYGSKVDLSAANISDITKIIITDNEQSGTVDLGSVFIDNYRFAKLSESTDDPAEPPHEHNFVEGKCECGEEDPNYEPDTPVEPPHEHSFVEGKCECGEEDPNYVPPSGETKIPVQADENGYIDFEGMTAQNSAIVVARTDGMLRVTEKNGSDMLEFIYTEDKTQEFDLYPTKSESGATIMIFEADVTDSLGQPRTLTFYAGTKKVYDFRFNGTGGITSENNQLSWGKGYYEKDVTYRLKITIEVTDGKIDTRVYINGTEIAKPSKYGTGYDLTADADTVSKISRVYVAYGYSTKYAGSVYIDNYRFVKLAGDDTPVEPPHEHNFVEGKCECGEEDPNYEPDTPAEPPHEHSFVEGKCECGEEDPNYVPPSGETKIPVQADENGYVDFEGMTAQNSAIVVARTEGMLRVTEKNGSDMLEFVYTEDKTQEFDLYPTKSESGATIMIFEADVTDSLGQPRTLTFYAGTKKVYDFRFNGTGGITSENNQLSWGKGYYEKDVTYRLKITIQVTDGKIDVKLFINGTEIAKPSKYGTGYDLTADADTVSKISRVYVAYGYSTKYAGSVYIDNYRFVKLAEN